MQLHGVASQFDFLQGQFKRRNCLIAARDITIFQIPFTSSVGAERILTEYTVFKAQFHKRLGLDILSGQ